MVFARNLQRSASLGVDHVELQIDAMSYALATRANQLAGEKFNATFRAGDSHSVARGGSSPQLSELIYNLRPPSRMNIHRAISVLRLHVESTTRSNGTRVLTRLVSFELKCCFKAALESLWHKARRVLRHKDYNVIQACARA